MAFTRTDFACLRLDSAVIGHRDGLQVGHRDRRPADMAPVAATATCRTQRIPSDPRGVDLRVDSADTRADGTTLSQQAEKHRLEAQKKHWPREASVAS